jgi:hypothetical protein
MKERWYDPFLDSTIVLLLGFLCGYGGRFLNDKAIRPAIVLGLILGFAISAYKSRCANWMHTVTVVLLVWSAGLYAVVVHNSPMTDWIAELILISMYAALGWIAGYAALWLRELR